MARSFAEPNRFGHIGRIPTPTPLGVGDINSYLLFPTLRHITALEVLEEKARVEDGRITECLVTSQVIFLLEEPRA